MEFFVKQNGRKMLLCFYEKKEKFTKKYLAILRLSNSQKLKTLKSKNENMNKRNWGKHKKSKNSF